MHYRRFRVIYPWAIYSNIPTSTCYRVPSATITPISFASIRLIPPILRSISIPVPVSNLNIPGPFLLTAPIIPIPPTTRCERYIRAFSYFLTLLDCFLFCLLGRRERLWSVIRYEVFNVPASGPPPRREGCGSFVNVDEFNLRDQLSPMTAW